MRLWLVDQIVGPAGALLNSKSPPLMLKQQATSTIIFTQLFWENYVPNVKIID